MSLKKEPNGRRSVSVEVEVPGTPEEVWQAIATGPGVSSWFVPTEVRDDGTVVSDFGPGMESVAKVTEWDPPRRFAADSADLGPDAPAIATEWIVEARSGGTCVVRVVHSLYAETDDWDTQLESWESGWPTFFRLLKLYLTHFRGMHGAAFQVMGSAAEPASDAWNAWTRTLGVEVPPEGKRAATSGEAPTLAGVVEHRGTPEYPQLILRCDQPAPGMAHLFALPMGGVVYLCGRVYLFGETASEVAGREEPRWQSWMQAHFPSGHGGELAGQA